MHLLPARCTFTYMCVCVFVCVAYACFVCVCVHIYIVHFPVVSKVLCSIIQPFKILPEPGIHLYIIYPTKNQPSTAHRSGVSLIPLSISTWTVFHGLPAAVACIWLLCVCVCVYFCVNYIDCMKMAFCPYIVQRKKKTKNKGIPVCVGIVIPLQHRKTQTTWFRCHKNSYWHVISPLF